MTAVSGYKATIVDTSSVALKKAESGIERSLTRISKAQYRDDESKREKYVSDARRNLTFSSDLEVAAETDLVIEAATENLKIKHKIFKILDSIAPAHTIFTSNTSSLSIGDIGSVTSRKSLFGGLHFFNPVPMMKLLEVVRTADTSEETYQTMMEWGKSIGKTCITCKDTPGFVVNRLLVSVLSEAARMLSRGDATAQDIDTAMKLGAGHPMGPLELCDYVGLDTQKLIMDGMYYVSYV